ncbi:MAG: glycosyltransferase [Eubacterium sp.]|nr:glycosyltransferase [Eubacterium sp.]
MKNINDIRKEKNLYYILPSNTRTDNANLTTEKAKAVVVACMFYEELLEDSLRYLNTVPDYVDICICTSNPVVAEKIQVFCRQRRNAFVVKKENRGRDISSLLVACKDILSNYEYICFIHDKKSVHALARQRWEIDLWIRNLWSSMLDSEQYIENVLGVFSENSNIGLLVPPEPTGDVMRNWYHNTWGPNFNNTVELSERLGLTCNISRTKPPFTIGTVFWCRYDAMKKLFQYDWRYDDFPEEPMASDGTISHAIERILGYVAQDAGYDTGTVFTCDYARYLISFVQNRLQEAFDVLHRTYNLYDFEQIRLAGRARRKYTAQVVCGVKDFAKRHKRIYIYGAGIWAKRIMEILDEEDLELEGILVTEPEKNPERIGNYKCGTLEEAVGGDTGIIIAIRNAQDVEEIRRMIDAKGLFDYVSVGELEAGKPEDARFVRAASCSVKFSILMPVYNVDTVYLSRAIKSVWNQSYGNWELCIADDASTDEEVRRYLYHVHDDRIKIRMLNENRGISTATNAAAEMACGDYLILMDHDDLLHPDALLRFYQEIKRSEPDIVYSDMDKVDEEEQHSGAFYKPQWSPDLLTAQMYVGHLLGFKRALFEQSGGFRSVCDGSQDYDLVLRMSMLARVMRRVEGTFYSWRLLKTSTALNVSAKPYTQTAALKALQSYLDKKYGSSYASVRETEWLHIYDVVYDLPEKTALSVIVPIQSKEDLSAAQLRGLQSSCTWKWTEFILVGNAQAEDIPQGIRFIQSEKNTWAGLCNDGAREARGDVIMILDAYLYMMTEDWAERLASNALRKDVGVVGGLILDAEGQIESAGVRIDRDGWVYDMYAGMEPVQFGEPFISPLMTRNVTAVSQKCMAFSKTVYEETGGFDEESMSASVDFCIAVQNENRWNIYSPYVKAMDYGKIQESSVCSVDIGNEMYRKYLAEGDPYYNGLLDETRSIPVIRAK